MRQLAFVVFLLACRSPEQTPAPVASATAEPSATTISSAAPVLDDSAGPIAIADAGKPKTDDAAEARRRALEIKINEQQAQMLKMLETTPKHDNVLMKDESERLANLLTAEGSRDAGRGGSADLRLGSGGGQIRGGSAGLSDLGAARDR